MKRLNTDDPNVWNKWRELYDELTDQEQLDFANECEARYPDQKHFTPSLFDKVLNSMPKDKPFSVLEIGGWKGELAAHSLAHHENIKSWLNIDICSAAVNKTVGMPVKDMERYHAVVMPQFAWFQGDTIIRKEDVCVSSNAIEHLSNWHFYRLATAIWTVKHIVFEAPLKFEGDDWTDYGGTHKLTMGWKGVISTMVEKNYSFKELSPHCYYFKYQLK